LSGKRRGRKRGIDGKKRMRLERTEDRSEGLGGRGRMR
jgi:hypothetical protein